MQRCKISETNDIHIKHIVKNHSMCEIEIASEIVMKNFIEEERKLNSNLKTVLKVSAICLHLKHILKRFM